jgi:hypothetical protein
MRRIGLDRIAFGRELSDHVSRNRFLQPTYGIPENVELLSLIQDGRRGDVLEDAPGA